MKVVKAPLRVSLFGGGCDLPEYADKYGATIVSFALDASIYLTWNQRHTGGCHLSYNEVEELDTLADADHDLVSAAATVYGIPEPCTLTIVSDIPKGTGLGSSSSLAVALCELVNATQRSGENLATTAYKLERTVANVGWQDHLPAAYGGFNIYVYDPETQRITITAVPKCLWYEVERYGLLLYTNRSRPASSLLRSWVNEVETLHLIRALAGRVVGDIHNLSVYGLARALQETWELKAAIPGVVDDDLWAQYSVAMHAGAWAGKLLGAGAGGCWFFLVPPERRQDVIEALGLPEIPFRISQKGIERVTL